MRTSSVDVWIMSLLRFSLLFYLFAYRFNRQKWYLVVSGTIGILTVVYLLIKFTIIMTSSARTSEKGESVWGFTLFSLSMCFIEYCVYVFNRRKKILVESSSVDLLERGQVDRMRPMENSRRQMDLTGVKGNHTAEGVQIEMKERGSSVSNAAKKPAIDSNLHQAGYSAGSFCSLFLFFSLLCFLCFSVSFSCLVLPLSLIYSLTGSHIFYVACIVCVCVWLFFLGL